MQERKEENAMCAAWWKERVFYQIYPRSFQDSNGDGIGDIPGIISRLDYLKWLGVGAVWLCPVYDSPNADMGYDIRDYEEIMSEFGTMEEFDTLLREMHKRDIKLVMDLVVNHSSDEHPWFVESRKSLDNPYRDYYIWRDGKNGKEPNNWSSFFTPSAWSYDEKTGQWYLHLFSEKQPDLNWENPKLREAVYAMMNRWFDRSVDGFRMDVISLIAKAPGLPDGQGDGYVFSPEQFAFQPKLHEYLREMRRRCFDGRDCMCVGETTFVTPENANSVVGDGRELDLLFQFDFMDLDGRDGKWNVIPFDLKKFKQLLVRWQEAIDWNTLFWGNHDQPRAVSRFASDASQALRVRSAKMLAAAMYLLRGTPWLAVNPNYRQINGHDAQADPDSILHFYRRLLALRQGSDALRSGTFRLLLPEHPQLLAYERACGEERIRVCCNFSGAPAVLPSEIQGDCLLCDGVENGRMEPYGLFCVQLLHH